MSIRDGTVVGTPVVHDGVNIAESGFVAQTRNEPSGGPSGVGAFVKHLVDFGVNFHCPAFGDLKHGTKTFHEVETHHGNGHAAMAEEVA